MPSIEWNKTTWDGAYNWAKLGDEWSGPWGGSSALWFTTLMPRLGAMLSGADVMEIAPGHGRCTQFLLRYARSYVGVDLSAQCVAFCRQRFAAASQAVFHENDGRSLAVVGATQFDVVFSFDSLVHADLDAMAAYVPQILRLLKSGGIAFLHHSNLAAHPGSDWQHRSPEVSAAIVADLVIRHGGRILIQEVFGGDGEIVPDCFTTFCRGTDYTDRKPLYVVNTGLLPVEGGLARNSFSPYISLAARE